MLDRRGIKDFSQQSNFIRGGKGEGRADKNQPKSLIQTELKRIITPIEKYIFFKGLQMKKRLNKSFNKGTVHQVKSKISSCYV